MLCSLKDLDGYELEASDGEVGSVKEVYFDDTFWVVRHLVVETGGWLSGRRVLISPHAILATDREQRRLRVALTRQQVQDAPGIETDQPMSRQQEMAFYDYYRYPYYWGGSGLWGMTDVPLAGTMPTMGAMAGPDALAELETTHPDDGANRHLRSSAEVSGYDIAATDGDIGHIDDFLIDDHNWAIRFVVVDTNNWLPDRLVLLSPQWIRDVEWEQRRAVVRATRQQVESSPPYKREDVVSHDTMASVRRHFERSE